VDYSKAMAGKKILLLIRHAEAQNFGPGEQDQNRPLTEFGKLQAKYMGEKLKSMGLFPNLFITSPATRTLQTTEILIQALGLESTAQMQKESKLYNATTRAVNEVIKSIDNAYDTVALIGHNPTISQMVGFLSQHTVNIMPTCGIVCLEIPSGYWSLVAMGSCNFIWFDFPPHELN
jgi:phosphohistidine phosphatase